MRNKKASKGKDIINMIRVSKLLREKIPNNEMTMDYREEIGKSNMIIYTTEDSLSKIETIFDGDTVWLSKAQMAEVIYTRVDAEKEFMGLTTFAGNQPTLREAVIAQNYLNEKELRATGQLVSGYLDFAERQAEREKSSF